jgi:hypothetical protein
MTHWIAYVSVVQEQFSMDRTGHVRLMGLLP